jgi:hypothetical protein
MSQPQPKTTVEDTIKDTQQKVDGLRESEKAIELIINKVNQAFSNADKTLVEHGEQWIQHLETCFNELAVQLDANGITLTIEEKAELRNNSTTNSSIQEKLKELEARQISLSDRVTPFSVMVYATAVAVLSRNLQTINNKAVKSIVGNLNEATTNESKTASKINSEYAASCEKMIAMVKQLEVQLTKVATLPPEVIQRFHAMEKQLEEYTKSTTAKPTALTMG